MASAVRRFTEKDMQIHPAMPSAGSAVPFDGLVRLTETPAGKANDRFAGTADFTGGYTEMIRTGSIADRNTAFIR